MITPAQTALQQVQQCLRYKTAHDMWFARMITAAQCGQEFDEPEPKLEDFVTEDNHPYVEDRVVFGPPDDPNLDNGILY